MQLSYASGPADTSLIGQPIGMYFADIASKFSSRDAIIDRSLGRRWTYAELVRDVDEVAAGFLSRGLRAGDRIGLLSPSRGLWNLVQLAAARLGATLVPINPAFQTHELRYVLEHASIRFLVSAHRFKTSDYARMIREVNPDLPDLEDVTFFDDPTWDNLVASGRNLLHSYPKIVADLAALVDIDAPMYIQYTSGTTGFPKGAVLSHHSVLNNGHAVVKLLGFDETDRLCLPVPLFHNFGMIMGILGSLSVGAAVIIPGAQFNPDETLGAIQDEQCTSVWGVPAMFIAQLSSDKFNTFDMSSLRTGIMAGSPCPSPVMKEVMKRMGIANIAICYGQTETSAISMQTRAVDTFEQRISTVGRVHPHVQVKIVDPTTDAIVPRGVTGEFCTRGYSVMRRYWQDPVQTAEAIDENGWMHSGDLAVMRDDGYVAITGRIKDMVIRGGENLYPREIEEYLLSHPAVLDCQVIGVPDEKYGEELMAWVRLRAGESLTASELREYCRGKLAHFKIPRYIHFVEEFPMTANGKVRKVAMRDAAIGLIAELERT
jgi:fatty-acyl-CoA synthase